MLLDLGTECGVCQGSPIHLLRIHRVPYCKCQRDCDVMVTSSVNLPRVISRLIVYCSIVCTVVTWREDQRRCSLPYSNRSGQMHLAISFAVYLARISARRQTEARCRIENAGWTYLNRGAVGPVVQLHSLDGHRRRGRPFLLRSGALPVGLSGPKVNKNGCWTFSILKITGTTRTWSAFSIHWNVWFIT